MVFFDCEGAFINLFVKGTMKTMKLDILKNAVERNLLSSLIMNLYFSLTALPQSKYPCPNFLLKKAANEMSAKFFACLDYSHFFFTAFCNIFAWQMELPLSFATHCHCRYILA